MIDTKKTSFTIALVITFLMAAPVLATSQTTTPELDINSANLPTTPKQEDITLVIEGKVVGAAMDEREKTLSEFLSSRKSPLANYALDFVVLADQYSLDYRFLPAIACLESSCGLIQPQGSHNPFGWGPMLRFNRWEEAIETVAHGIRTSYVREGKVTPQMVGPKYASSPTWASRVTNFMLQIENTPI